jgi:2-polyprenyl-3-methyl-5-hydroxy-6-metoxy-1,4-benzoquinol methylase
LLDFGCAWGYKTWQIKNAGYVVKGFEISKQNSNYARENLGIEAYSSWDQITGTFDIFFSTHVLEHVPNVRKIIDKGWQMLRPNGLFIAFTPNGSTEFRTKDPSAWHSLWGGGHINFLDKIYYNQVFNQFPRFMSSATLTISHPFEELKKWDQTNTDCKVLDLSGDELLIAVRKPK